MTGILKVDQIQLTDGSTPTLSDLGITVPASGKILQVVTNSTNTPVSSTAITYTDTGLTASITPTSTSSKILVLTNQMYQVLHSSSAYGGFRLLRNSTVIHDPASQSGYGTFEYGMSATVQYGRASITLVDEPNTTSSVTYKTMQASYDTSRTVVTQYQITNATAVGKSYITLMEIAG